VSPPDPDRACLELAAGCVYEGGLYPNAFQWIELQTKSAGGPRGVRVHFRTWVKGKWQVDYNQPGCEDGTADFTLERPPAAKAQPTAPPAPAIPAEYLQWLRRTCSDLDLLGQDIQQGQAVTLSQVYVPALTQPAPGQEHKEPEGRDEPSPTAHQPSVRTGRGGADQARSCTCPAGAAAAPPARALRHPLVPHPEQAGHRRRADRKHPRTRGPGTARREPHAPHRALRHLRQRRPTAGGPLPPLPAHRRQRAL
jgi:hypothetical protein